MTCKYCGSSYEENDKYCPICGRSTTGELEPVTEVTVSQPQANGQNDVEEAAKNARNSIAITSFVLGMLNIVGLGFFGTNIAAIILGIFGIKSNRKGFAVAGIIISVLAILVTIALIIFLIAFALEHTGDIYGEMYEEFYDFYDIYEGFDY